VDERASLPADRAVAYAYMIQVGVDFESNPAAMAGPLIGLLHGVSRRVQPRRGLKARGNPGLQSEGVCWSIWLGFTCVLEV